MKYRFQIAAQLIGVTSIACQILLMREMMLVFYGNELSVSILLGMWLVWIAIGSGTMGRFGSKLRHPVIWLAVSQLLVVLIIPLSIMAVRECRHFFDALPGEMISLWQVFEGSLWSLLPLCILIGAQFVLVCRVFAPGHKGASSAIGGVYLHESLGAGVAGLILSVLLVRWLSTWQIAILVCCLNLLGSLLVLDQVPIPSLRRGGQAMVMLLLIGGVALLLFSSTAIEKATLRRQWKPLNVVESRNSVYGNITVTQFDDQYSFFENGLLISSTGDIQSAEENTHLALLQHPMPETVLLIGGGLGGSLREILKHPVRHLDYVELDPLLIQLATKYHAVEALTQNSRAHLHHIDARLWVQRAKPETYDVILLNLPGPVTAQLARFYSIEFFEEARSALRDGGILAFATEASENYVSIEQQLLLNSLELTLSGVFSVVEAIPGEQTHLLAQKVLSGKPTLTRDPDELQRRIEQRGLETQFVNRSYLPFRLNPMRLEMLDVLRREPLPETRVNRDLQPIAYLHDLLIWLSLFEQRTVQKVGPRFITHLRPVHFVALGIGLLLLVYLWQRRHPQTGLLLSIGSTGFSEILFQIVVILAFQVLYGYVYYKLSLILTAFMIGLMLGAWLIRRLLPGIENPWRLYRWTQFAVGLYPLVLLVCIDALHRSAPTIPEWIPVQTLFALLPIVAGFLGGFQFPLAGHLRTDQEGGVGRTAGILYGVDLFGACIGAILGTLVFVPIFGLLATCWLIAALNLGVWLLLLSKNLLPPAHR